MCVHKHTHTHMCVYLNRPSQEDQDLVLIRKQSAEKQCDLELHTVATEKLLLAALPCG